MELNVFIGIVAEILVVIAGVVVVIVDLVVVFGRHVRSCRSVFRSTGNCVVTGILPG